MRHRLGTSSPTTVTALSAPQRREQPQVMKVETPQQQDDGPVHTEAHGSPRAYAMSWHERRATSTAGGCRPREAWT